VAYPFANLPRMLQRGEKSGLVKTGGRMYVTGQREGENRNTRLYPAVWQ
jgi:hypothetical protein